VGGSWGLGALENGKVSLGQAGVGQKGGEGGGGGGLRNERRAIERSGRKK